MDLCEITRNKDLGHYGVWCSRRFPLSLLPSWWGYKTANTSTTFFSLSIIHLFVDRIPDRVLNSELTANLSRTYPYLFQVAQTFYEDPTTWRSFPTDELRDDFIPITKEQFPPALQFWRLAYTPDTQLVREVLGNASSKMDNRIRGTEGKSISCLYNLIYSRSYPIINLYNVS